ncbi:Nif11-like leader peptide family natural product precursor [Synechococcus sp. UW179A]|uniref:Nif11-like leader peptide family natural product precursor n=1 Tax=Synechococcus sp. UW179A TaxID=2575510 RepID=UPI000E0EB4B0|nr:Nif11-like leader peptide family natural product precursor [Synechococcus sp. UW179A]
MSEEQLKAFLEKVKGDTSLQEKLKAAANPDAVLAIAKEAGFSISVDLITKAHSEISEEELEDAAGGNLMRANWGCLLDPEISKAQPWWAKPFLP